MPLVTYRCDVGHVFKTYEKDGTRWGTCPTSEFKNDAHGPGRTGHVECRQYLTIMSEEDITEIEWLNRENP